MEQESKKVVCDAARPADIKTEKILQDNEIGSRDSKTSTMISNRQLATPVFQAAIESDEASCAALTPDGTSFSTMIEALYGKQCRLCGFKCAIKSRFTCPTCGSQMLW